MQVDPLAEVSYVLRSFIGNAGDVILIDEHGGGALRVRGKLLHIDDRAIGDAANLGQPKAPLVLDFVRSFRLAAEQCIAHSSQAECAQGDGVRTEWNDGLRLPDARN